MEKAVRVCWYCEKWQPGGIQAVQVNLLEHMDLSRIHMDVVVSQDETELFDQRLKAMGVRKIVTLKKRYPGPGRRVLANIFAFGRLLRKNKYDVVHLNVCHGVELVYGFWAWLYGVPVRIVHCRNNDIGAGGRSRRLKLLCHRLCKVLFAGCANIKLANSDLAAAWLFPKGVLRRGQVTILPNGIDARRYAFDSALREETRRQLHLEDKFVVGHVGHFSYQKNHEFLLEVFRSILEQRPDAVLLLVGTGEGQPRIQAMVREWGMEEQVLFYGVTQDVPAVMMAMDVFLFPSRFEGFGNVLLEAQASGLTCFASRDVIPQAVKICEELIWVDLKEPAVYWAQAVLQRQLPCPRHSRVDQVVARGHDISHMAKALEQLYLSGK